MNRWGDRGKPYGSRGRSARSPASVTAVFDRPRRVSPRRDVLRVALGVCVALLGWIVLMAAIDVGLLRLGVGGGTILLADILLALLLGFEAATLERWSLSRGKWRQLDIVVADNREAAERRFFERWTAKQRALSNDQLAIDRGAPPPTREIPGQPFSKPPPLPHGDIIGLFPDPGAPR